MLDSIIQTGKVESFHFNFSDQNHQTSPNQCRRSAVGCRRRRRSASPPWRSLPIRIPPISTQVRMGYTYQSSLTTSLLTTHPSHVSHRFRAAGLGMTNYGRWRPRFPPAPTSPRCSAARRLLWARAAEAFLQVEGHARSLSVAEFFALVGDVEVSTLYRQRQWGSIINGGYAALCFALTRIVGLLCSRLG
jgi:hypothetical protein